MKIFAFLFLIFPIFAFSANGQNAPIRVFLAGDSTLAEKRAEKRPETGWGEFLQKYFDADTFTTSF